MNPACFSLLWMIDLLSKNRFWLSTTEIQNWLDPILARTNLAEEANMSKKVLIYCYRKLIFLCRPIKNMTIIGHSTIIFLLCQDCHTGCFGLFWSILCLFIYFLTLFLVQKYDPRKFLVSHRVQNGMAQDPDLSYMSTGCCI